jgi:UDP-N-acetylglucosamine transferase subunit ALG13
MIFVTVGVQLPFDRLVSAVDEWAARNRSQKVFAQIGKTDFVPNNMEFVENLTSLEFSQRIMEAQVIVAHAGMGSILSALEAGKPIIVLPRRAELKEHRNNHQLATARYLAAQNMVSVVFSETHLAEKLNRIDTHSISKQLSTEASPGLIEAISSFINNRR